jgi:hypothetical protein
MSVLGSGIPLIWKKLCLFSLKFVKCGIEVSVPANVRRANLNPEQKIVEVQTI